MRIENVAIRNARSGRAAIRINDATCTDNVVGAAIFLNNVVGCLSEALTGIIKTGTLVRH